VFTSDGKVFFCQACKKYIVAKQQYDIIHRLCGSKHTAAIVCLKDVPGMQSLISKLSATSSSGPSKFATFATDLCKAFVSAQI
jgi:hypothetical protein